MKSLNQYIIEKILINKSSKLNKIKVESNPYFDESGVSGKIEILIQLEGFDIIFVNKEEMSHRGSRYIEARLCNKCKVEALYVKRRNVITSFAYC